MSWHTLIKISVFTIQLLMITYQSPLADDFTINTTPGWDREIAAMSDYIVRGISQTRGTPSVSGLGVYTFQNGLYGGIAVERSVVGGQGVEADLIGGWKTGMTPNINYNFGFDYPFTQFPQQNTFEFQNIVNYVRPWGTLIAAFTVQPQGAANIGLQTYSSIGVDFNLPYNLKLGARLGYLTSSNHLAQMNYVDWTVTVARDMGHGITLATQYTGLTAHCDGSTGVVGDDGGGCTPGTGGNRIAVSINFSF